MIIFTLEALIKSLKSVVSPLSISNLGVSSKNSASRFRFPLRIVLEQAGAAFKVEKQDLKKKSKSEKDF